MLIMLEALLCVGPLFACSVEPPRSPALARIASAAALTAANPVAFLSISFSRGAEALPARAGEYEEETPDGASGRYRDPAGRAARIGSGGHPLHWMACRALLRAALIAGRRRPGLRAAVR